ncbi:MAG TPA: hypothetical protein VL986_05865 [Terracidiphilus sp.]|nr:hypothetical protein [Terracidiphilus sp.]
MLEGTSAWVKALQLTAILAAAGFIGKLALQQLLGIELGNWAALDLSIFAGRWAVETISIILDAFFVYPFVFGLPALVYLSIPFTAILLPATHRLLRPVTYIGVGMALAGLVYVLFWCEIPSLTIENWLTHNLSDQLSIPVERGVLAGRQVNLKAVLLVSKMDGLAHHGGVSCSQPPPAVLMKHLSPKYPVNSAQTYLNLTYAVCCLICVAGWLIAYFRAPFEIPYSLDKTFRIFRLLILFVLLPLATSLIPYVYGKLIYSTKFPLVSVVFSDGSSSQDMLLLDENDKEISFLSTVDTDAVPVLVQVLPRDQIKSLRRYGEKDIFNDILLKCEWIPPSLNQPVQLK